MESQDHQGHKETPADDVENINGTEGNILIAFSDDEAEFYKEASKNKVS